MVGHSSHHRPELRFTFLLRVVMKVERWPRRHWQQQRVTLGRQGRCVQQHDKAPPSFTQPIRTFLTSRVHKHSFVWLFFFSLYFAASLDIGFALAVIEDVQLALECLRCRYHPTLRSDTVTSIAKRHLCTAHSWHARRHCAPLPYCREVDLQISHSLSLARRWGRGQCQHYTTSLGSLMLSTTRCFRASLRHRRSHATPSSSSRYRLMWTARLSCWKSWRLTTAHSCCRRLRAAHYRRFVHGQPTTTLQPITTTPAVIHIDQIIALPLCAEFSSTVFR
jgi:hypothetical protein